MNRAAATVTRFCEQIASATGLAAEDLRVRCKYMREAGMLPQSARGRGATPATTYEAVKILLAALGGGMQNRSPELVGALWTLRYERTDQITRTINDGGAEITARQPIRPHPELERNLENLNFGAALCVAIDECRTEGGRHIILNWLDTLHVWQAGDTAMIQTLDGYRFWYRRPFNAQSPAAMIAQARVSTMTTLPAIGLAIAAGLTLHPSALQTNQAELALSETKDAPRPMAGGASESVSQRNANSVDPLNHPDSAPKADSGQERELGQPNVVKAVTTQGDPSHGSIVSFRAAAVA